MLLKIGLTESIFAAAASRVGKTVLHIDANDYYGGQWASFNLESIQTFVSTSASNECVIENAEYRWTPESIIPIAAENIHHDPVKPATYESVATDNSDKTDVDVLVWTKDRVLKEFRKFNIDITPKVHEIQTI